MKNPLLLLEYQDLYPTDFDVDVIRICFIIIAKLYNEGAVKLTPIEVDQEIEKFDNSKILYQRDGGLQFLTSSYEIAEPENFEVYYNRVKKYSLLRRLRREKYDISEYYVDDKDLDDPLKAVEIQEKLETASLESILNSIEAKYNIIRSEFLNGGRINGDPAENIDQLIDKLLASPSVGADLEGEMFSSVCRGARLGCFFLKSASTSAGKTRTSVFDACRLCYPIHWSHTQSVFIEEVDNNGEFRPPRKVLFIVTEMDKEELQTIMLAYLSGVDEDHILRGAYDPGELERVRFAAQIMTKYSGYFIIEEIAEPNLTNVSATIKKYATIDQVKYIFFDYLHTTASMVNQFAKNNLGEHTILMMMANQLKQLAKDYNIFIFSATQVNVNAMNDDGEFKNETCIRGSKSVSDKADVGYVMTRVPDKLWESTLKPIFITEVRRGNLDEKYVTDKQYKPTHILDIYKMRRGRYKNIRIWINLHLGTGYRKDLFITTANNQPLEETMDLLTVTNEYPISDWRDKLV